MLITPGVVYIGVLNSPSQRTKYVLLDDPLSAVDSHTARLLFEKLLRGPLMANRTVVCAKVVACIASH